MLAKLGLVVLIIACTGIAWPGVIALPLSIALAWIGVAILGRARRLWLERRRAAAAKAADDARVRERTAEQAQVVEHTTDRRENVS
jgi:hypothetical protein